jgi:hypothetical protein
MPTFKHNPWLIIALRPMIALCAITTAAMAHAQLGTTIAMVSGNLANTPDVVIHQADNPAVQWNESTDTSQIRVRQYVSAAGQVYAISWNGPAAPDLTALLGAWSGIYRQEALAALPTAPSLHASRVDRSDVVVETAVRLRSFSGRAWLPGAIPAGVLLTDIQ